MILYPAIDLSGGRAVRLLRGDYAAMTVYSDDPVAVARSFRDAGATHAHLVDLDGAKTGETPNLEAILRIKAETGLFCEVGGGVRSMDTLQRYLDAGLDRVILGTAAVTDPAFLEAALARYGARIAVGVDIQGGFVAIRGWTERAALEAFAFCRSLEQRGVQTLICTDISRDGAMQGANRALYQTLAQALSMDLIASGGVSSLDDIRALKALGLSGVILGKAYYTGAVNLPEALEAAT